MKIYNLLVIVLISLMFIGCGSKDPKPTSLGNIVIEKKVAVACEVPKAECDFKGEMFEPTIKLLECVKLQKEIIRICTETK